MNIRRRWICLTPARLMSVVLLVEVFLLLSQRYRWFAINDEKGVTVLVALTVAGFAVLATFLCVVLRVFLRGRFQFGLRSLLFFVFVLSVPLGWFALESERARRQRCAVDMVLRLGGKVYYDHKVDVEGGLWFAGEIETKPAWLRRLFGDDFLCEVWMVNLDRTEFDDDDTGQLRNLPNLEVLWLTSTEISDNGLEDLKGMSKLEFLWVGGHRVTDGGVKKLQRALPHCKING